MSGGFQRWAEALISKSAKRPRREIRGDGGAPYLERFYLWHLGPIKRPWLVVYLHRFVASDPDLGLHDHPWPWACSLVLRGSYLERFLTEQDAAGFRRREAGSWQWFNGRHRHRVCLLGEECWTLFMHGPWRKPWGFYRYVFDGPVARLAYEAHSAESSAGWWKRA